MNKFLKIKLTAGPGAGTFIYFNANLINTANQDLLNPTTEINCHLPNSNKMVKITGTGFDGSTATAVSNALKSAALTDYTKVAHEIVVPKGQGITLVVIT
tara:strand:- start:3132 stop:3431 length:300 start_codon:yes stop_codon:yes gene_type:complete